MADELTEFLSQKEQELHGSWESQAQLAASSHSPPPARAEPATSRPVSVKDETDLDKLVREFVDVRSTTFAEQHRPFVQKATVEKIGEGGAPGQAARVGGGGGGGAGGMDEIDAILMGMNFDTNAEATVGLCFGCRQPIKKSADHLDLRGRKYHLEHLCCVQCRRSLGTGDFYERSGLAYCPECYRRLFTSQCARCERPIASGEAVLAAGRRYHPDCFSCAGCRQRALPTFFNRDGSFWCERCYFARYLPRCAACQKPVAGSVASTRGLDYHPECFVCKRCGKVLQNRYLTHEGVPFCLDCHPQAGKATILHPQTGTSSSSSYSYGGRSYSQESTARAQMPSPVSYTVPVEHPPTADAEAGRPVLPPVTSPPKVVPTVRQKPLYPASPPSSPSTPARAEAVSTGATRSVKDIAAMFGGGGGSGEADELDGLRSQTMNVEDVAARLAALYGDMEVIERQKKMDTLQRVRVDPEEHEKLRTMRKMRTATQKEAAQKQQAERLNQWQTTLDPPAWRDSPAQPSDLIRTVSGYHLETGAPEAVGQLVHIVREDPFYRYNLKEADHDHFITEEGAKEPIIVAIDAEPARLDTSTKAYRAIVRTPRGDYRVVVRCERKKDRIAALRKAFPQLVPANARLRLVKSLAIRDVMVEFDEKNYKDKFKFGVVFARAGQTAESQMFQNEHGSPGLETFLNLIAERVELATHTGYHGGLKAYPGHSYYTKFHGTEIMLHVSTLLPYKQGDPQQIERKRQIGNDVVIIVYRDEASGKDQIEPHSFTSHFNHVFVAVKPVEDGRRYQLNVSSKEGVRPHLPLLPPGGLVDRDDLREFLLTKCINAEVQALHSLDFAPAIRRTRKEMLQQIIEKFK